MLYKLRKSICILLALLLLTLAACGSSGTSEEAVETAGESTAEAEEEAEEESETAEETAGTDDAEEVEETEEPEEAEEAEAEAVEESEVEAAAGISYPIEGGGAFTYFYPLSRSGAYTDVAAECQIFTELEARTGVEITFISPSWTAAEEQYNLMIASNELTDLIMHTGGAEPLKGYDYMIEEEMYLPLNDLMQEYAPDYYAIITADDDLYKGVTTDSGYLYGFMMIYDEEYTTQAGLVTRQDWLTELGLEVPTNIDDFTQMLEALKVNYDCSQTIVMTSSLLLPGNTINAAYGTNVTWVVKDGTEYLSAYTLDGFRDYIALLADYYAAGYFTSDFVSVSGALPADTSSVYSNETAVWVAFYNDITNMKEDGSSLVDGFDVVPIPKLSLTADAEVTYDDLPSMFSTENAAITTACENPEVAAMWLNYFYTEEGTLLANYGEEGVTFEYDEDGNPVFTEFVTDNPDGKNLTTMLELYALNSGTFYRTWARNFDVCDPADQEAYDLWNSVSDTVYTSSPTLTLTEEESDVIATLYSDITTYAEEVLPKYVMGTLSMDQWDEFLTTIESMGIDEVTAAYQAALDRYNAR